MKVRNGWTVGGMGMLMPALLLGGCENSGSVFDIVQASINLALAIVDVAS